MQGVRIIDFPKCKMVSSGTGMFGEEKFERFGEWFSSLPRSIYSKDYLYHNGEGFCWLYLYDETLNPPNEFEIVDFNYQITEKRLYLRRTIDTNAELLPRKNAPCIKIISISHNLSENPDFIRVLGVFSVVFHTERHPFRQLKRIKREIIPSSLPAEALSPPC